MREIRIPEQAFVEFYNSLSPKDQFRDPEMERNGWISMRLQTMSGEPIALRILPPEGSEAWKEWQTEKQKQEATHA